MARMVSISRSKASKSQQYRASWIGKKAFWLSYEGDEILGTITHWDRWYPVVTFADGTWGRLDESFLVMD